MTAPDIIKKRQDFLAAARARKQGGPAFLLQARETGGPMRVGFTCSKKVGNAVARNRAKRRLRAVARDVLPKRGRDGWDYVLIGKAKATAERPYTELCRDLERALRKIHAKP